MRANLLRAMLFHYGRALGNGRRALRELAAALAPTPEERVLDVGCGTGGFCRAVPGLYVGIDIDPDYIAFARWRWGGRSRRFERVALEGLDPAEHFDKAMLVSCLHHLSDAEADATLARLARLLRRRLVVIDLDPDSSNWLQSLFLAMDRGHFIRPRAVQRALLERHFRVAREGRFLNTPRTAVLTLFVCESNTGQCTEPSAGDVE
jgi:SAM-dependent methyltransferase